MKYHNTESSQLFELIQQRIGTLRDNMADVCHMLAELDSRGETHPAMGVGALRHFKLVANGTLSPLAAFVFNGIPSILDKLKGMPLDQQEGIAKGEKLDVVTIDLKGAVVVEQKPITRLAQPELNRVIVNAKIVPVKDQEKAARAAAARQPVRATTTSRIKVDKKARQLIFGNMKFAPEDLTDALRELGFRMVRIERVKETSQKVREEVRV